MAYNRYSRPTYSRRRTSSGGYNRRYRSGASEAAYQRGLRAGRRRATGYSRRY